MRFMQPDNDEARAERATAIASGRGAWKNPAKGRDLVSELINERRAEAELDDAEGTHDPQAADSAHSHLAS